MSQRPFPSRNRVCSVYTDLLAGGGWAGMSQIVATGMRFACARTDETRVTSCAALADFQDEPVRTHPVSRLRQQSWALVIVIRATFFEPLQALFEYPRQLRGIKPLFSTAVDGRSGALVHRGGLGCIEGVLNLDPALHAGFEITRDLGVSPLQ